MEPWGPEAEPISGGRAAPEPGVRVREHLRAGREEAARLLLVEATQDSVFRFLRHLVRDNEATEDLFQDTYLRAFRALAGFRGESSLTTWVLTIARNLAWNHVRRRRTEAAWVEVVEEPSLRADPRGPEPGGPGSDRALDAALGRLTPAQREAVLLYYLEDRTVEDVARMTGRPVNTIKSDLRRARLTLREALNGEEAFHDRS